MHDVLELLQALSSRPPPPTKLRNIDHSSEYSTSSRKGSDLSSDSSIRGMVRKPHSQASVSRNKSAASLAYQQLVPNTATASQGSKFASNVTKPKVIQASGKHQFQRDLNAILNGITDEGYESNVKRVQKVFSQCSPEDKPDILSYVITTLVDMACKQPIYAPSYSHILLLLQLDKLEIVEKTLQKTNLLFCEEEDERLSRNSTKSLAIFFSGLVAHCVVERNVAVTLLNKLLDEFERAEGKNENCVEFITVFLCAQEKFENTLKTVPDEFVRETYQAFLLRLVSHWKKASSYAGMRLLDVKDCFNL